MIDLGRALLALLLAAPAAAAGLHTSTELGARAVFYRPNDADHGVWGEGVQLKTELAETCAIQSSADLTHHSSAGTNYRTIPLQFTLLGYFTPDNPGSLFLLLGGGWYFVRSDGAGGHAETQFHPHAGFGAEFATGKRWTLDVSYRYIWSQVYRLSDYAHPFGSRYVDRGSMVTAGLSYRF